MALPPDAEKACGFPDVREDLPAFFFRRRLCPDIGFTEGEIVFIKSRNPSLSGKKKQSGNRPVEEGDWKIPQGISLRKLEISSTAGLPGGSGVFYIYQPRL